MKLKNITVQIGGFHDHWVRNGTDNPTLLMAAMEYYNYDFICLLDGKDNEQAIWEKNTVEQWLNGRKVYLGEEIVYGWGHIISIENSCMDMDVTSCDWRKEMKKIHAGGGIVALAHIGYPDDEHRFFDEEKLNELIDNDYVDAIQLEKTKDWNLVKKRANRKLKLPFVGGWDSHCLMNKCDSAPNLFTNDFTPGENIDSAPGMRTIVFAEDNSLESLKKAVREGKCVLEHVETRELFGSYDLVELLISEGYLEMMREYTVKYENLRLSNENLTEFEASTLKFPGKGVVNFPIDSALTKGEMETDENGFIDITAPITPGALEKNYIPFFWKGEKDERLWAVKIFNSISLKVYPTMVDNKKAIIVETKNDISGNISFKKPIEYNSPISGSGGEKIVTLILPENTEDVFDCAFEMITKKGKIFKYERRFGVAVAMPAGADWDECPVYCADSAEQCGGFGSNRLYPGKEIFSGKAQFKWDEKYLYFKCDIVDSIHVPPPSGQFMYTSDCISISFDAKLTRNKEREEIIGMYLGFPEEGFEIFSRNRNLVLTGEGKLFLKETEYGRIVTAQIPWKEINIEKPYPGMVIGMHFSFLNDDGDGLLDNVHWPVAEKGMSLPDDLGTLYLM